jgi:signal transduction histidine kinase
VGEKMVYVSIISVVLVLLFLARLLLVQKEIRRLSAQLRSYNSRHTDKKVDIALIHKDIEELAGEVNRLIDLRVQENVDKRRVEHELKQAIANISHDLRTPLTSVLGYIQLLDSEELSSEDKKSYLAITKNRTKQLQSLLTDFFELSVIDSMDYELRLERLKLNNLVGEILLSYYEMFRGRQIEPIIQISDEAMMVNADAKAVTRVIENLILNAIRHSNGNVAVTLEQHLSSVVLIISNDTERLTETDVSHFFDRFYKADQTRSGNNTGLGLSIAQGLMRKMNGEISAELIDNRLYMKCKWPIPS